MVALFVLAPSFFHYASVTVLKSTLLFTEKHATMKCFSFMSLGNTYVYCGYFGPFNRHYRENHTKPTQLCAL